MKKAIAIFFILLYSSVAFSQGADCDSCSSESGLGVFGFGKSTYNCCTYQDNGNSCSVEMITCKSDNTVLLSVNVQRDFSIDSYLLTSFLQLSAVGHITGQYGPLFPGTRLHRKSSRQLLSFIHILRI